MQCRITLTKEELKNLMCTDQSENEGCIKFVDPVQSRGTMDKITSYGKEVIIREMVFPIE